MGTLPDTRLGRTTSFDMSAKQSSKIRVFLRTRPTSNFAQDMIEFIPDSNNINIHAKKNEKRGVVNNQLLDWTFKMDGILHNASQEQVFETVGADVVNRALDGYNATIMCYGQTGAGKTFTMTGATENYQQRGLIPRVISAVYQQIEKRVEQSVSIRISYLEIYNENMFDLLSTLPEAFVGTQAMTIIEDEYGVSIKGLACT
ncbi:putative kinesin-like protein KIF9 [Apostichopus japonicus]|uniref:Putative kinesin-like protein KIF9 n=1 Tax=Stichopus japonicus TaxID=307972 RepID=A0A2G8JWZ6_STIJA|nr:putative kinesin-like protein KIF9 [Apostichopus japonicus]